MSEGYAELIQYLDEKFNKIGLDLVEVKTDKADKVDIASLKKSFNDLQTSVDTYAQKADTYFQEMAMLTHKVNRLEKFLEKVAEKLDMKFEY